MILLSVTIYFLHIGLRLLTSTSIKNQEINGFLSVCENLIPNHDGQVDCSVKQPLGLRSLYIKQMCIFSRIADNFPFKESYIEAGQVRFYNAE